MQLLDTGGVLQLDLQDPLHMLRPRQLFRLDYHRPHTRLETAHGRVGPRRGDQNR